MFTEFSPLYFRYTWARSLFMRVRQYSGHDYYHVFLYSFEYRPGIFYHFEKEKERYAQTTSEITSMTGIR